MTDFEAPIVKGQRVDRAELPVLEGWNALLAKPFDRTARQLRSSRISKKRHKAREKKRSSERWKRIKADPVLLAAYRAQRAGYWKEYRQRPAQKRSLI